MIFMITLIRNLVKETYQLYFAKLEVGDQEFFRLDLFIQRFIVRHVHFTNF